MKRAILTLNAGSSSLKFALFEAAGMAAILRGAVEDLGVAPHLLARDDTGNVLIDLHLPLARADPLAAIIEALMVFVDAHPGHDGLAAVGHRVVFGGADHVIPERVTPALFKALESLTPFDPIHMPLNLAAMRAIAARRPDLPQIACFDTAFHQTLPLVAQQFALPRSMLNADVRRYGFHGLSYEYVAGRLSERAPELARGRVVVAHLGSGASLCALRAGISVATTMGLSVLDGLVMATRCGTLDPGVILYLGRQGHSFSEIEQILYDRSGLLGVSGISGDIRVLLASDHPHARDAVDLFAYRVAIEVGAMASALGGLDGIVFTAGIGEHSPEVRAAVCDRLTWLGVLLDEEANTAGEERISAVDSKIEVRVMATDEEATIAHHTRATLDAGNA